MLEKAKKYVKWAVVVGGAGAATWFGGPAAGDAALNLLKGIFG